MSATFGIANALIIALQAAFCAIGMVDLIQTGPLTASRYFET